MRCEQSLRQRRPFRRLGSRTSFRVPNFNLVRASILSLCAGLATPVAHAPTDSIAAYRGTLVDIAKASDLPRLDSGSFSPTVRREIRIYTGFGIFTPEDVVRVWEDNGGAHGRFGLFWRHGSEYEPDLRALVDTAYDCRAIMRSRRMNVCWLDSRPSTEDWARLITALDRLRVDSIPSPVRPKMGFDGWSIIVEVRSRAGYRAYHYWSPDSTSTDTGERAAARIAEVMRSAFDQRLAK